MNELPPVTKIPGLEKHYISECGRVFEEKEEIFLEIFGKPRHGYSRVLINGKRISVHRLLAKTFIPNPRNLPVVRHLNDDRSDIRLENLAWGTTLDNYNDSLINKCSEKFARKLSAEDVVNIRKVFTEGSPTKTAIANQYGVSRNTINRALEGSKHYKWVQ